MPPVADYGFVVEEEQGKTWSRVAIRNIAIVETNQIKIDLGRPIARGRVLYAMGQQEAIMGWAGARGQLTSSSGETSGYYMEGYPIPETILHYCVRFVERF